MNFGATRLVLHSVYRSPIASSDEMSDINLTDHGRPNESAAALLAALEQAIDAVVMIDNDNFVTHFNAAAERLWGYDRDEVLGRNVSFLVPHAMQREHDSFIATNRITGVNRIIGASRELKIERKDGSDAWASFSLSRVDTAGKITYMAFARDVTEEVKQREHLALLSLVADKTDRVVIVTDCDKRIVYVNDAFVSVFGFSREEASGKVASDLICGPYTDRDALARMTATVDAEGHGREDILAYDARGNEIWVSVTINSILDDGGNVRNFVGVLADITESKQIHSLQHHILEALADDMPVRDVIAQLCSRVESIAPDVVASVFHVDSDGVLHPLGAPSLPADFCALLEGVTAGPDVGSSGAAAFLGEPVLIEDIATDPRWERYKAAPLAAGLRSCWSTPVKAKDGRVIGAIAFYFREKRGPTAWHKSIVDACVHLCALAIERHEARTEIDRLAYYDTLTGLPNRVQLHRLMGQLIADGQPGARIAVMFLDIDHFKDVNDTMGHSVGDELLISVTRRLRAQMRPADTLSRQGGDEFVVVLPNCDAAGAAAIARRILDGLESPIQLGGKLVPVSASIGVSIYPDHATDIEGLLRHADAAMYKAKQAGRSTFRFFSTDMNRVSEERLAFSVALRNAIAEGALRLHYQPQIRTIDGSVYGVEALARWHDPVLGEVPPSKFIPLAEECGLIEQIGVWTLREACQQIAVWRHQKLAVPCVSVNLSPISFQNGDLATLVAEIIADHDLPPEVLMLEITEGMVMSEDSNAVRTMEKIRASGVGLSMDDFGTGYSSLSRLAHLPIRELKIDRSFMQDIESKASALAITTAVVRVGQSLNMKVVAEGVETDGQRKILTELGCDVIQGFLYSPALSPADFERWLEKRSAERFSSMLSELRRSPPQDRKRIAELMPSARRVR
jgi:diguanylate cyclase (GGDEF)-like protein/PAS domain S-box-containing protein